MSEMGMLQQQPGTSPHVSADGIPISGSREVPERLSVLPVAFGARSDKFHRVVTSE
jgi:hypothetical protein